MFDWDVVEGEESSAECDRAGVAIFHRSLPALLSTRFPVIIDHGLQEEGWYRECRAALEDHRVLYVGVHCPLDILREREISRRDRRIGLAEWQLPRVHCHAPYDLEVNTAEVTPEEGARLILAAFGPTA
jgi:chloramphenicol 3-O phosphotransferase